MKWFINLFKRKKTKVPEKIELRISNSKPLTFYTDNAIANFQKEYSKLGFSLNDLGIEAKRAGKNLSDLYMNNLFNGIDNDILNLKPNINSICKVIYEYKDNIEILINIRTFVSDNRKKLSLSHLKFIYEYLNDKMKNL